MADQSNKNYTQKRSFNTAFSNASGSSGGIRIPITKSLIPGFCPYFEGYGEIESIAVCIRFKEDVVAESVLRKRYHKIENRIWTAEPPSEPSEQPNIKKIKLVESTPAHILDLEDKTLTKILGYLNLIDLSNVSETCVRLDGVAKQLFALKHSTLRVNSDNYVILQRFGDLIKNLKLVYDAAQLFDVAVKYCKNVETLVLSDELDFGVHEWNKLVNGLTKLKHLEMRYVNHHFIGDVNTFLVAERMETLKISKVKYNYSSNSFSFIVKMMPNLRLFDFCNNLLIVTNITDQHAKQLCQLKSLRQLSISCVEIALVQLLDGLRLEGVMIDNIELAKWDKFEEPINDIITAITKLKSIKVLGLTAKFGDVLENKHLLRLANGLPWLNEFKIQSHHMTTAGLKEIIRFANRLTKVTLGSPSWRSHLALDTIGAADFEAILNIVERRSDQLKLTISLPREVDTSQIDADMRERNRERLQII